MPADHAEAYLRDAITALPEGGPQRDTVYAFLAGVFCAQVGQGPVTLPRFRRYVDLAVRSVSP